MTENKRFIKYNNSVSQFEDTEHKDLYSIYDGVEPIIQLLNQLNDENKQYAIFKLQDKDRYEYCNELKKENDRLKSALARYGMKLIKEAEEILND